MHGKTQWATSLSPTTQLYFNTSTNWGDHHHYVDHVIFDDFQYDILKPFLKMLFGGQQRITVTDKYVKKYTLNWGHPSILLTNNPISTAMSHDEQDWWRVNVVTILLNRPLF